MNKMNLGEIEGYNIDHVPLSKIEHMCKSIRKTHGKDVDIMVGYDYLVMALFPNAYNNLKDFATKQYMDGYKAGKESRND